MNVGDEHALPVGSLLSLARPLILLLAPALVGCDNSPPAPTEAMARQQWEMSIAQNRREMEKQNVTATARTELAAKDREIARLQAENDELRERIVRMEQGAANDGHVMRVDAREGIVWLDRGESDGVKVKQVFQVIPANGQVDLRHPKSEVEVTRLLGPHLAEARILDLKALPAVEGDRIQSQQVVATVDIPKVNLDEGEVLSFEVELEMVEISLGTRAGLVKGERLHLYREGNPKQYLGQIQVLNAAPNKAFAQIVGGSKQIAVEAGDRVCKRLPEGLVPAPKARVD